LIWANWKQLVALNLVLKKWFSEVISDLGQSLIAVIVKWFALLIASTHGN